MYTPELYGTDGNIRAVYPYAKDSNKLYFLDSVTDPITSELTYVTMVLRHEDDGEHNIIKAFSLPSPW